MLTPDLDLVRCNIDGHHDVQAYRLVRANGTVTGVDGDAFYTFDDQAGVPTDDQLETFIADAEGLATDGAVDSLVPADGSSGGIVGAALAGFRGGPVSVPAAGVDGDGVDIFGNSSGDGPALRSVALGGVGTGIVGRALGDGGQTIPLAAPGLTVWEAAEDRGGFSSGDVVPTSILVHALGDRGVFTSNGVSILARHRADGSSVEMRVLPIKRDSRSIKYRDFKDAVDNMHPHSELPEDWTVNGPRTAGWVLRHMQRVGGTPVGFHNRWMAEVRLDYGAQGCSEHLGWCKFLETAATYDQLNLCGLACVELGVRRLQMISEKWRHKMPSLSGSNNSEMDDAFLLLGTSETRGNILVAPELQSWLGEQLSKEALASKERRKAREERALAAKAPQGPKTDK